jgi:hypothetical protein
MNNDEFELSMSSTQGIDPPDKVRLRVNMMVDWRIALEVYRMLSTDRNPSGPAGEPTKSTDV